MIPGVDAFYVIRDRSRFGPYTREMLWRLEQLGYVSWADRVEDGVGGATRIREVIGSYEGNPEEMWKNLPPVVARILGVEARGGAGDRAGPVPFPSQQVRPFDSHSYSSAGAPSFFPPPVRGSRGYPQAGEEPREDREWIMGGESEVAYDEGDGSDNDDVILRVKPSPWNYPMLMVLAILCFLLGLMGWSSSRLWLAAGCGVASVFLFMIEVRRASRVYLVSRLRVEAVTGLFARSSKEMRVWDVKAIDVRKTGWRGILNIGDVRFSATGSDQEDVIFFGVSSPHRVKRLVRSLMGG